MKNLGIYAAVAIIFAIYNAATTADRDDNGAIVDAGSINAFSLRVGDCFDDSSASFASDGEAITNLPGVPCAEPHDNEVFAVFDVALERFTDAEAMATMAYDSCMTRFEAFVGTDYDSSKLDILTMYPTRESWNTQNDREVVCAIYDINATKLVGSAKGLAL